jgi:hypothetical protein
MVYNEFIHPVVSDIWKGGEIDRMVQSGRYGASGRRSGRRANNNSLASDSLKAGSRMYFFDIKEAKSGKPYLSVTETRYDKGSGQRERSSVFVYPEDVREFFKIIRSMVQDLVNITDELDRKPRQQSFDDERRRAPRKRPAREEPIEDDMDEDDEF